MVLAAAGAAAGLLLAGGSKAAPVTITPTSIAGAKLGDTDVTLERLWGGNYRKSTHRPAAELLAADLRRPRLSAFFVGTSDKTVEITTSNSGGPDGGGDRPLLEPRRAEEGLRQRG